MRRCAAMLLILAVITLAGCREEPAETPAVATTTEGADADFPPLPAPEQTATSVSGTQAQIGTAGSTATTDQSAPGSATTPRAP